MVLARHLHFLAAGEDLVPAVLLVPLGERRRHVHLLDDVPPADAGVVGAEGNLALLRRIRNDAHLGAAEVVVEQVLEPHAGDEQEVPAIGPPLLDVRHRAVAGHLAVVLAGGAERLVELLHQVGDAEVRRRLERVVVAHQRQRHPGHRQEPAARGVVDLRHVLGELIGLEERGHRHRFLGFLVDHHRHADAAVRVAAAGELAPLAVGPVDDVRPVGEGGHERDREPVADRLADAGLVLHVVRQVRQRVALRRAALRRDLLVAAGERDRLEREEIDPLRIVERELDDPAHLLVVDAVDDRDDRHDVDAGLVEVLDRAQLHVEEVADAAMRVGGVADAVELQVGVAQARFGRRLGELRALGELDAVGRRLHAVVADLARVADRVEEVRRHRRLAAGELHRHLPPRLDRDRVVEHLLDVFPRQLVDEPDLVRVHEAGVAHHVAAVGQVDRQHRAAAVLDGGAAVVVQLLVVVRADVASREHLLEVLEERRVHRHHVLEVAVEGAVLHHQDLAVALDDRRLDLADLLVEEDRHVLLAVEDLLPRLARAGRAERVGLARPAERRLGLLIRLQQRLVRPSRRERRVLLDLVGGGKHLPDTVGGDRHPLLHVLHWRMHRPALDQRGGRWSPADGDTCRGDGADRRPLGSPHGPDRRCCRSRRRGLRQPRDGGPLP